MDQIKFEIKELQPEDKNTLHIGKNGGQAGICVYNFVDKDTKQFVAYAPALDISGYGDTEDKAVDMMKFAIENYIDYLTDLSAKERDKELASLGWKKDRFKNKDFSRAYIDINGELKNFNAEEGSVKRQKLEFA